MQTIDYVMRYGGHCRDCADEDGICPRDGTPCEPAPKRAVIEHTLKALEYGMSRGFIQSPFPRPVAPVEGLETVGRAGGLRGVKGRTAAEFSEKDVPDFTEVVTRPQAEDIIAAKVEQERLRFEGELDKWMKIIGAGITGYQPEAYALMDLACQELVKLRADNAALTARVKELEVSRNEMDNIAYAAGFYQAECNLPEHTNAQEALKEYRHLKTLETQLAAARKALARAAYGFDQIHKSLMSNRPKQASGEVTAFFLADPSSQSN